MGATAAAEFNEVVQRELDQLERLIEGLRRAWITADDGALDVARNRVEDVMKSGAPWIRELCEDALTRLERVRLQARLRRRERQ